MKPEIIDSYEVGLKGSVGRAFSYTLAAYHLEDKDIQVQSFPVVNIPTLTNAARGRISGFEATGNLRVDSNISLNAGFSYIHAKYASFKGATALLPKPSTYCPNPNPPGPPGSLMPQGGLCQVPAGLDAAGNWMIRPPQFSGSVGINALYPVGAGKIEFNGNLYAQSRMYYDPINVFSQKAYATLNASLAYIFPGDRLKVMLHAENITNTAHILSLQLSTTAASVNYAPPTTYGIRAEYKF